MPDARGDHAAREVRTTLLEMAREWERLADQQERATDLCKKQ